MSIKESQILASMPTYHNILYGICQSERIDLHFLSTNWVKQLTENNQTHYIVGYKFDLNPAAASMIADDKCATYAVLQNAGIPAVEHAILYNFEHQASFTLGRNSFEYFSEYFINHNKHIVLKPNCGTGGASTFQITEISQAIPALLEIFNEHPTASLCPFYQVKHEYRTILLDGVEQLSYMKTASINNWKFNLQQGATASEIPSSKRVRIINLAKESARILGLRFCSVDVIETTDDNLLVLEVNSGVMIQEFLKQHPDKLELVKDIYHSAIRKMFEK